ncbi:MAG TPA: diacylglycerol kinase family protein [Anaerolineales bacterium]
MPNGMIAYNPNAGRYPSRILTERARDVLREYGWELILEQTTSGDHTTQLAKKAADEGMDAIFIAGGDGSVNRAMRALIGTDTALGVLPCGTANVWAQELGLPGLTWTRWMALEESARRLATAPICAVDIGLCNNRPFLLWAGVGLDAFVVHNLEPRSRWEKHFAVAHYAASIVWHASYWHGVNIRIETDAGRIFGHFLLALVSNVHLYAGGYANLSPHARLDDGSMDLWLFKGETLGDTVQLVWDLLAGRHIQSERVHQVQFQSLRLESESPTYVQVDGEPIDVVSPVTITVQPKALRVLVPENTPQPLFNTRAGV